MNKPCLNAGAQLQTLPDTKIPKAFPYSNALKSFAQTLPFKSVTDKQKMTSNFFVPGGARSPTPTTVGAVIEEIHTILARPKVFASNVYFRR